MNLRVFMMFLCFAAVFLPFTVHADVSAYLGARGTSAVDAKGVRHNGDDYPRKHPPWLDDRVKAVAPDYPYSERARRHEGAGWFQLALDLRTGAVTQVSVA